MFLSDSGRHIRFRFLCLFGRCFTIRIFRLGIGLRGDGFLRAGIIWERFTFRRVFCWRDFLRFLFDNGRCFLRLLPDSGRRFRHGRRRIRNFLLNGLRPVAVHAIDPGEGQTDSLSPLQHKPEARFAVFGVFPMQVHFLPVQILDRSHAIFVKIQLALVQTGVVSVGGQNKIGFLPSVVRLRIDLSLNRLPRHCLRERGCQFKNAVLDCDCRQN